MVQLACCVSRGSREGSFPSFPPLGVATGGDFPSSARRETSPLATCQRGLVCPAHLSQPCTVSICTYDSAEDDTWGQKCGGARAASGDMLSATPAFAEPTGVPVTQQMLPQVFVRDKQGSHIQLKNIPDARVVGHALIPGLWRLQRRVLPC